MEQDDSVPLGIEREEDEMTPGVPGPQARQVQGVIDITSMIAEMESSRRGGGERP